MLYRITAANQYAMQAIREATTANEPSVVASSVGEGAVIAQSFRDVTDTLARETQRSLLEAAAGAANLERLQENLFTIHEICLREGVVLRKANNELLSELWTILGGNRRALRDNQERMAILKEVDLYRRHALAHVIVTRDALQMLAADVEELRERSVTPHIVGERMLPELLLRSIGDAIDRLKEERQRAVDRQHTIFNRLLVASEDGSDGEGSYYL